MQTRLKGTLTLALAALAACTTVQRSVGGSAPRSKTTSLLGQWVLATPMDSTAFAGAAQVDLNLLPGSFTLMVTYPNRAPLTVTGKAEIADENLTLTPTTGGLDATNIGFPPGQPYSRVATASGSTLVLAPPTSRVPVPSSVWYRLDAARMAGLAR